jgi:hypothetical protein
MKDMKRIMMIIMAAVLVALPIMAQQQEWRSTSAMQGTGSSLAPQVTAVGATSVGDMATTTGSAKASGGPRKIGEASGRNPGDISTGSTNSPIGDALLPLMLMALAFGGYVAIRRKKLTAKS